MKKSCLMIALSLLLAASPFTACSDDDNGGDNNGGDNNGGDNNGGDNNGNKTEIAKLIRSADQREQSKLDDDHLASFVNGQYDLNFELLRAAKEEIEGKNAMISTFSIQTALAMVWAGANGDTANEMMQTLHFDDHTHEALNKLDATIMAKNKEAFDRDYEHKDPVEIKTSNNLYFSPVYTWQKDWLQTLAVNYDAGIWEMDFAADPEKARKYINDVVSEDTHNRINDLLPKNSISNVTRSVITNAIYFKAPWEDNVYVSDTQLNFKKLDDSSVSVKGLRTSEYYAYMADEEAGYQAVSMPLRDGDFNVMFVLPDEGKFDALMDDMNEQIINHIFDSYTHEAIINLNFPAYTFDTEISLKASLNRLGMNLPFADDADFSKMTEEPNALRISEVYHKTFIGLDEKGVEAAAATAVSMSDGAVMEPKIIKMSIDRPFFFVIYESETKTPLFVGRVMDPSQK